MNTEYLEKMKSTDWIDEIGVESATPYNDHEWLQDWIETNLERSTIGHELQATILRNLTDYTMEELIEIKKEILMNWMNPFNELGRYGLSQVFIWWK